MKKFTLLTGVGIGYVLGTRAGREKYDQLAQKASEFAKRPEVVKATDATKGAVTSAASAASAKVTGAAGQLKKKTDSAQPPATSDAESVSGTDTLQVDSAGTISVGDELGGSYAGIDTDTGTVK